MTSPRTAPVNPPEYDVIVSSLNKIRGRLWLMRLAERVALAIAVGTAVAVVLVCSRLVCERSVPGAMGIALVPMIGAAWLWVKSPRFNNVVLTPVLVRLAAVIIAVLCVATLALVSTSVLAQLPIWSIPAGAVAILSIAAAATVRVVDTRSAAIFVDQQIGLKERVSTALEFIHTESGSALEDSFRRPLIFSALAACTEVRRARIGYSRLDRRVYALMVTGILAASGISLLTPLPAIAKRTPTSIQIVARNETKLLEAIKAQEKKFAEEHNDIAEKKIEPLKKAVEGIRNKNMDSVSATEAILKAGAEMKRDFEQGAASEKAMAALENANELNPFNKAASDLKDANLQANATAGSGATQTPSQQKLDQETNALGDKLSSGKMSDQEKKKLAGNLRSAAEQAKGDPQLQSSLNQAADATEKGDGKGLSSAMKDAGARMGQMQAEHQLSGQALKDAMAAADDAAKGMSGMSAGEQQANSGASNPQGDDNGGSQGSGNPGGSDKGGDQSGNQQGNQQGNQGSGDQANGQDSGGSQDGSKPGDGNQPGAGAGEAGQKGDGQAASGSGSGDDNDGGGGSTNIHGASGPGGKHHGNEIGREGTFVKLYESTPINSRGEQKKVSGKINPLKASGGSMDVQMQGDKTDGTIVPYNEQRENLRPKVMDDLQRQQIPPQYRDLIINYYEK